MLEGEELSRFLDILGNRNRRRIIQLLRQKPCFVTEISERLMISPKAVIEHLQMMEREHILLSQLDSRRRKYYYLSRAIKVVIDMTQEPRFFTPASDDARSRLFHSLHMLRRMIESRETLITNLEYLERDIDQKINEIMKYSKDILLSEPEMNLVIALSTCDLTLGELEEVTEMPARELAPLLRNLLAGGIVERTGEYYRVCDDNAK